MPLEHKEVIPIVEDLALARDGEILISDTYLPADRVPSLMRTAGIVMIFKIVVSNDGIFRDWIGAARSWANRFAASMFSTR